MVMQNFLRDALVFAENETSRAATCKRHSLHFQEGNDVLVEPAVVLELISQIKNHVGREGCQFLAEQIEIMENGEMFLGMTEGWQGVQEVGLVFQIFLLIFFTQVLLVFVGREALE